MTNQARFLACSVLWALLAVASAPAAQQPDPRIREHVDAVIKALSNGSPEAFEAMARDHFAAELLAARPQTERARMVQRVHSDFGELTADRVESDAPGQLVVTVKGRVGGTLRIHLTLEPSAPFRITRLALQIGGDEGREGPPALPPPAIDETMPPDVMARELDKYLAGLATSNDFAGVVLVAKDGRTILERGYGEGDRERHAPMTTDLRFNIASIGKAFTKAAIGQLIQQGKLSESDTIGMRLPDYPTAETRSATIDQLLHHTAGVADFFGPRFDATPKAHFESNADYYRFVSSQPSLFPPGTRNQYCNGCYVVLGEIIARVSGVPYEQYIVEHVFKPAGMTGAAFAGYGDPHVTPGYTRHAAADGALTSNASMHGRRGSAAGGAYARAADLLAFDNAVREGRLLDPKMTGWYFETPPISGGRARAASGIAGGAPGANAVLESDGAWAVIVVGNLDPPNAMRVAAAISRQLQR